MIIGQTRAIVESQGDPLDIERTMEFLLAQQARFAEYQAQFAENQGRLEENQARFEANQARFEENQARFEENQARSEERQAQLEVHQLKLAADLSQLNGIVLEVANAQTHTNEILATMAERLIELTEDVKVVVSTLERHLASHS
jgi:hypothetical protein